ncbi:hypothetical protein ACP3P8_25550 [Pseudomonas aeruginosa]
MGNLKVMNDRLTMTSLELVGFVNAHRKQQAELAGQPFPSKGFAKLRAQALPRQSAGGAR